MVRERERERERECVCERERPPVVQLRSEAAVEGATQ